MQSFRQIETVFKYHHFFGQALTLDEVYTWQYGSNYPKDEIKEKLGPLVVKGRLKKVADYYFLPDFDFDLKKQNNCRYQASRKLKLADKSIKQAKLPKEVVFVGVTGSVAAGFALSQDDIDLVIVVKDLSLWLARLKFHLFNLNLPRRLPGQNQNFQDLICLNLWLEAGRIKFPPSLYTAHELLNTQPIYDPYNFHSVWLSQNNWLSQFFPVKYKIKLESTKPAKRFKPIGSASLIANGLAYLVQRLYMLPKQTKEQVGFRQAFFHKRDYKKQLDLLI